MKKIGFALALVTVVGLPAAVYGEGRIDHFKGEPAPTLEAAIANFSRYNRELAAILARNELDVDTLVAIHELTYTLENALEKINVELTTLTDTLEALHVASETADFEGTREYGQLYLDTARTVIP